MTTLCEHDNEPNKCRPCQQLANRDERIHGLEAQLDRAKVEILRQQYLLEQSKTDG
jgi:hypothetical protein